MNEFSLSDITACKERHKLYLLQCDGLKSNKCLIWLEAQGVPIINIGKELSIFIDKLEELKYLNLDVHDYLLKILETKKTKINNTGNQVIAIHNLGILMEDSLELNAAQLLKEISKTTALIIIWENEFDSPNRLNWPSQRNSVFLDFTDTPLKTLHYAI